MIREKLSLKYIHNRLYALLLAPRAYPTNFWTTLYALMDAISNFHWPKPIACRPNDTSSLSLHIKYKCSRIYNSFRLQFFSFFFEQILLIFIYNASCSFLLHFVSHFVSQLFMLLVFLFFFSLILLTF
jgi:hypothetical protein